jgi:hypothetical protein
MQRIRSRKRSSPERESVLASNEPLAPEALDTAVAPVASTWRRPEGHIAPAVGVSREAAAEWAKRDGRCPGCQELERGLEAVPAGKESGLPSL